MDLVKPSTTSTTTLPSTTTTDDINKTKMPDALLELNVDHLQEISSGEEKCDMNPEHSKKSDTSPDEESVSERLDSIQNVENNKQLIDEIGIHNKPNDSSRSLAFTIDFDEDKVFNSKKYNDIVERFQKRHKRGVSLSKLDDPNIGTSVSSLSAASVGGCLNKKKPPLKKSTLQRSTDVLDKSSSSITGNDPTTIKLRDKSLVYNGSKESGQRHSWSPRTSLNVPVKFDDTTHNISNPGNIYSFSSAGSSSATFKPKSTILQKALQDIKKSNKSVEQQLKSPIKQTKNIILCSQPPLDFVKKDVADDDAVSEAGTYTLDGDNYTEEQKAKMSIDKMEKDTSNEYQQHVQIYQQNSPTLPASIPISNAYLQYHHTKQLNYCDTRQTNIEPELKIIEQDGTLVWKDEKSPVNILTKPKTSYLEKIKSKVRTIGDKAFHNHHHHKSKSPDKQLLSSSTNKPTTLDIGSFTSVTASGVFSKTVKSHLPTKLSRRSSLTTSQVDSSEYVQRSIINDKLFSSYTDYEKAMHNEYKLNVFSHPGCVTNMEKENRTAVESLGTGLERAETKSDWIQEWAKSARRNTTGGKINKRFAGDDCSGSTTTNFDDYRGQYAIADDDYVDANYMHRTVKIDNYRKNIHDYEFRPKSANAVAGNYRITTKQSPTNVDHFNTTNYRKVLNEFGVGSEFESDELSSPSDRTHDSGHFFDESTFVKGKVNLRPPISPTKIPSPMHTLRRGRSCSVNRDGRYSNMDIDDTEMYLHKTAAAISTLQQIQRKNNSPQSPLSPDKTTSIRHQKWNALTSQADRNAYTAIRLKQLHKRNNSVDGIEYKSKMLQNREMSHSFDPEQMSLALNSKPHTRHNSYEDKTSTTTTPTFQRPSSKICTVAASHKTIEQTFSPQILMRNNLSNNNKYSQQTVTGGGGCGKTMTTRNDSTFLHQQHQYIKRSSSFSTKHLSGNLVTKSLTPKLAPKNPNRTTTIQKSASSASFKNMTNFYDTEYYLNEADDLNTTVNIYTSESDLSETDNEKEPITNTRYNKAFLIRMEQNKQKATVTSGSSVKVQGGMAACPNTPELPRRENRTRSSVLRDRASMPRDSSLNRMKQEIPSLNISKKVLTTKSNDSNRKVQPKYLDISKYKQTQGNSFLKRDESKSTLINKDLKRSSSAFVALNKMDTARSSMRSVKSATSSKSSTPSSNNKETELAMWRRRASYDPMKAAAEGKKRQEEARKAMQSSKYNESSSIVLRSQSFHNGIGQTTNLRDDDNIDPSNIDSSSKHRWTLLSTESSDDEFIENY